MICHVQTQDDINYKAMLEEIEEKKMEIQEKLANTDNREEEQLLNWKHKLWCSIGLEIMNERDKRLDELVKDGLFDDIDEEVNRGEIP